MEKLRLIIEKQQKGNENKPEFTIGLQLLDMAASDSVVAELLKKDLETDGMKLSDAVAELKKYADKNHGKAKCFCISPTVAEEILRKFYGLPNRKQQPPQTLEEIKPSSEEIKPSSFIDLSSFL